MRSISYSSVVSQLASGRKRSSMFKTMSKLRKGQESWRRTCLGVSPLSKVKHSQCKNANTLDSVAPRLALLSVIVMVMCDRFGRRSDFQWLLFRRGKKEHLSSCGSKLKAIFSRVNLPVSGKNLVSELFSSSRTGHLLRQVERPATFRDLPSLTVTKRWFQGAK